MGVLEEVIVALKERHVDLNKFHVYVDGGVRRGTDIFKCMALGAKGCGLGRPFLYGIAAYGQEGAEKVFQLLRAELEMCMRLMGTPSIKDIRRDMVTTRNLPDHFAMMPQASPRGEPQPHDANSFLQYLKDGRGKAFSFLAWSAEI